MRRAYRDVAVRSDADTYQVLLDDKPLMTPAKAALSLPTRSLAEAIAEEWRAQGAELNPASMPLTRLAATAIDRVRPRRQTIVEAVAAYGATDLLCYRTAEPPELVAREAASWQPVLDWVRRRYDAHLAVTTGIQAVTQSVEALARLRAAVAARDDWQLAGLQALTETLGSLALALALQEGEHSPEATYSASQLHESFQIERWGADEEAMLRREELRRDVLVTARFLQLLAA